MSRKPIVAGNWKMNKTVAEAEALTRDLIEGLKDINGVDVVLCPPFIDIPAVTALTKGSALHVGAQNMHWEKAGAFTGEVSPAMLQGLVEYVIIGHSERRQYFAEIDETVNKKILAALAYGLKPIVCVGESLDIYEAGKTAEWVEGQVRAAFKGLSAEQAEGVVIAYEPIWAIGTGKAATAEGANTLIGRVIRGTLAKLYGEPVAQAIRIQYGGSANAKNMAEFMAQPEIDGALVGGASLKAADFTQMVKAADARH